MKQKKQICELTVQSIQELSPHVVRVVFTGEGLAAYPDDCPGGHVKLMLSPPAGEDKPTVRTYTIRSFDRAAPSITLEFTRHEPLGPATRWLAKAKPGDTLTVGGPGAAKRPNPNNARVLFAGDLTSLPAISANLERLPAGASGHCLVQIPDPADARPLTAPAGVELRWVSSDLPAAVRALPWPADGALSAWVAGEYSAIKEIRSYLKEERGLAAENLFCSSYYKRGEAEEEHRALKQAEARRA